MLRNYFTVAIRNLVNNKLYSAINIGGLAVGLAACLLILLFVRDELSYDRWLPDVDRIAATEGTFYVPGREPIAFASTPGPAAPAFEKDYTSDVERAVRIFQPDEPLRAGDRQFIDAISYVDPGFFEVFDIPVARGDRDAALANNKSILLSDTLARRYFGDEQAIGKTITANGKDDFTVVGVFDDLPRNTHLDIKAIALFDTARYKDKPWIAESWTSVNTHMYLKFRSREAMDRVAADLDNFADRNVKFDIPGINERPSTLVKFNFMPVADIHLHATKAGYFKPGGEMAAVVAFGAIAALILLIACINFVNLATARSMKRAREVALRKVVGATRGQLIRQHLGEAILTALIALVVAVALVEVSLAPFNGFLHKQLRLDFTGDPMLFVMMLGLIVGVGVVGGLYPAVFLSRFRPAQVLKANQSSVTGSSLLRTGLVVFQFAISIALIVCTATVYSQTTYARRLDTGFQHDDKLTLRGVTDLSTPELAATLKTEVAALPGVRAAALSSDGPPLQSNNNTLLYPTPVPGNDRYIVETLAVDVDFFRVLGVAPLAGRVFSTDHPGDVAPEKKDLRKDKAARAGIVINQAFLAKIGIARPEDGVGKVLWDVAGEDMPMTEVTIVGVVPDLHLRSVRDAITPLAYYLGRPSVGFDRLTVDVEPGRMRETLAAVHGVWARLAPTVPVRTSFVDEDVAALYDADAQRGQIFGGFALFAVLIACLGLFGLASFAAERRTKEIGMRKVLGASVLDIVRLLVWQFSKPVLVANLIAWPVSFYLMSRWLSGFRYAIDLTSPVYLLLLFGGAGLIALAIAWGTIAGHAYRVARASPGRALRCE